MLSRVGVGAARTQAMKFGHTFETACTGVVKNLPENT